MFPEEVYVVFDLPWELNEMIARYLAKMLIREKLEFPREVFLYYHAGFGRPHQQDFCYDSDTDEYFSEYRTSCLTWRDVWSDDTEDVLSEDTEGRIFRIIYKFKTKYRTLNYSNSGSGVYRRHEIL